MRKIINEPDFAWWTNHIIKKRNHIIPKTKSKYQTRTHRFGIQIPKYVKETKDIYQANGRTLWWDGFLKVIEISKCHLWHFM